MRPDLSVRIGPISMKNPLMVASGTHNLDYGELYPLDILGAYVPKTIRMHTWPGNPPPRTAEVPSGVVTSVGIPSKGWDAFVREDAPRLRALGIPVILSVVGKTEDEYAGMAERAGSLGFLAGVELNLSCPNIKAGGLAFGSDAKTAASLMDKVRKATSLPVIPKLPPDYGRVVEVAKACEDAGADAIAMINAPPAMVIDVDTRQPVLGNRTGGLSGPAIRPMAVYMIYRVYKAVRIPIIGMGGACDARDVIEFMLAGARAVALGTVNFFDPMAVPRALEGLREFTTTNGIDDINSLVGAAH